MRAVQNFPCAWQRAEQDGMPQQRQRDQLPPFVQAERRRLPDVGLPARQQRRPPHRHGERVTVGDPQPVTPVRRRVTVEEHLADLHVQARRERVLRVDGVLDRPFPYGRSTSTALALAVAGHRRPERHLQSRLVRVAEPRRVVGAQHDVGVQLAEPWVSPSLVSGSACPSGARGGRAAARPRRRAAAATSTRARAGAAAPGATTAGTMTAALIFARSAPSSYAHAGRSGSPGDPSCGQSMNASCGDREQPPAQPPAEQLHRTHRRPEQRLHQVPRRAEPVEPRRGASGWPCAARSRYAGPAASAS